MRTLPKVSIILPVYNGENYLRYAVESVLAQSYRDYELLILDNASTDATGRICKEYADQDARIRYHRHAKNLGASMNHILGFRMAVGDYVTHIAHDDAWAATRLEECVVMLNERPELVLVYPMTVLIDENGKQIEHFDPKLDFSSPRARDRMKSSVWGRHRAYPVFGVVRYAALAKTKLLQPFVDSDRVWLARLALQGPFGQVPKYLFFSRMHSARYGSLAKSPSAQLAWFDPARRRKWVFPSVRLYGEYLWAVLQAELPLVEKMICLFVVATCFRERWWRSKFKDDLVRPFVPLIQWLSNASSVETR